MPDRGTDHVTRTLSSASFSLTEDVSRGRKTLGWAIAATVLLLCVVVFSLLSSRTSPEIQLREELRRVQEEVHRQQTEISELKMSLGHERATRETLERELASQTEALKQANKNLGFYRSHAPSGASVSQ